jgi:hypothetical protein
MVRLLVSEHFADVAQACCFLAAYRARGYNDTGFFDVPEIFAARVGPSRPPWRETG